MAVSLHPPVIPSPSAVTTKQLPPKQHVPCTPPCENCISSPVPGCGQWRVCVCVLAGWRWPVAKSLRRTPPAPPCRRGNGQREGRGHRRRRWTWPCPRGTTNPVLLGDNPTHKKGGERDTAATWVAPTGALATRALGCGGRTGCGCLLAV
jgi:hypothetical protein